MCVSVFINNERKKMKISLTPPINVMNSYSRVNLQPLQTTPSFGNKQKIIQHGVEKLVVPAIATAGAAVTAATVLAMQNGQGKSKVQKTNTIYGPVEYTPAGNGVTKSSLVVSRPNGMKMDIFKDIPQTTLETPVAEHIRQIESSTINPKVGIVITQNQSKPVVARKIVTDGTLENSLVRNNLNNIPLKYDVAESIQYADTPWYPGRQNITGNCLQVTYGTVMEDWGARPEYIAEYADPATGEAPDVGTLAAQKASDDRSFMPADIAGKQYEIITDSGERVPCNYEDMTPGVDYKISKKAGVELKMAVPPTEVTSSEGENLPAGKLYMVDSNGHFYNGNPIKRIKSGEVTWTADMGDPVQATIRNLIDESLRLEAEAKTAKKEGNVNLANELSSQAKSLTQEAEMKMTEWVKSAQISEGENFFAE